MRTNHCKQLLVGVQPSQPRLSWLQTWVFVSFYDNGHHVDALSTDTAPFSGQLWTGCERFHCSCMPLAHADVTPHLQQSISTSCGSTRHHAAVVCPEVHKIECTSSHASCPCCSVPQNWVRWQHRIHELEHTMVSIGTKWFQLGHHAILSRLSTLATLGV